MAMRLWILAAVMLVHGTASASTVATRPPKMTLTSRPPSAAMVASSLEKLAALPPTNPARAEAFALIAQRLLHGDPSSSSAAQLGPGVRSVIEDLRAEILSEALQEPSAGEKPENLQASLRHLERLRRLGQIFLKPAEVARISALAEERRLEAWFLRSTPPRPDDAVEVPDAAQLAAPKIGILNRLQYMCSGRKGLYRETGFNAFFLSDPVATKIALRFHRRDPASRVAGSLGLMYRTLVDVTQIDSLPLTQRAGLAHAAASGFSKFLTRLASETALSARLRDAVERSRDRMADGALVNALLNVQSVWEIWRRVTEMVQGQRQMAGLSDAANERTWRIPPPTPDGMRAALESRRETVSVRMKDVRDFLNHTEQTLIALLRRRDLLSDPRNDFLPRFLQAQRRRWVQLLCLIDKDVRELRDEIRRFRERTIPLTLSRGRRRGVLHVPTNKGLTLIPEEGGYLLRSHFKSSIEDPRFLKIVKDSIEQEWTGTFVFDSKQSRFRTEVLIERLKPDEDVAGNFLLLRESDASGSVGDAAGISLRRVFNRSTPAHEFGHVLGLADEYDEIFDFDAMRSVYSVAPDNLMSNCTSIAGKLLPEHFKLAFLLLRRNRLGQPL